MCVSAPELDEGLCAWELWSCIREGEGSLMMLALRRRLVIHKISNPRLPAPMENGFSGNEELVFRKYLLVICPVCSARERTPETATRLPLHVTRLLSASAGRMSDVRAGNSKFMRWYEGTEMVPLDIKFMRMIIFLDRLQFICTMNEVERFVLGRGCRRVESIE